MARKIFSEDFRLSIAEIKQQPYQLVKACRNVMADPGQTYSISRKSVDTAELALIDSVFFSNLVTNLDPGLSQPVLVNYINLNVNAVAVRFDEIYNVAAGTSEFPGSDPNGWPGNLRKSGFELKIQTQGTREFIKQETVLTSGNVVTVAHPVDSTAEVAAEDTGGMLQVAGSGGISASLVVQDITFTSVVKASSANNITVQYIEHTAAQAAHLLFEGVQLTAVTAGTAGNGITIATVNDGVFGAETATLSTLAITVHIAAGQTNAAIVANVLNTTGATAALVSASAVTPLQTQVVQGATHLAGGLAAVGLAGSEVVTVSGSAITVQLQGGVSTATQVHAKLNASAPALALATNAITGTGSHAQNVFPQTNLMDGQDALDASMLGQIELSNNGSSIPDNTSVNVSYPSEGFTAYQVQVTPKQQAIICRQDLIDYLMANSL